MIEANLAFLPRNIYTDIGNNLNYRDYSSFRESCEGASEALYDDAMLKKITLDPACFPSIRKRCNWLLTDRLIRSVLTNENNRDLRQALNHCFVRYDPNFRYEYQEVFVALLDYKKTGALSEDQDDSIRKSLFSLEKKVRTVVRPQTDSPKLPRVSLHQENSRISMDDFNREGISFHCTSRMLFPVEAIFEAFNEKFNHSSDSEKCLIATIANELKKAWLQKTPFGGSREVISKIPETYEKLFLWGAIAKSVATE